MIRSLVLPLFLRFALAIGIAIAGIASVRAQSTPEPRTYWPTEGWRTASPESQGMDADLAEQIEARIESETPLLSSMLVVKGGYLVYEGYFNETEREDANEVWSVAKSVTNIAVGIAFREGLVSSTDQTLGELIPDLIPEAADTRVPGITLFHLLTSTAGWEWDGRTNFQRHDETDQLDVMLARPMVCDPGDCFEYDSTNTNLLSAIITELSGETMAEYLQPRLFDPLGIETPDWLTTELGYTRGAGGLSLTPRAMAELGFLYLNGGVWDGQQIVEEDWVDESTRELTSGASTITGVNIGGGPNGFQWWVAIPNEDIVGFDANGYGGQFIYVVPDLDLVVVTTTSDMVATETDRTQRPRPIIEELIVPQAIDD